MGSGVVRGGGYLAGVRAGLPFALVVGVVGFSFGALARSLGCLVVTGTFGEGGHLTIDEKALGVGVAAVALALRAPLSSPWFSPRWLRRLLGSS